MAGISEASAIITVAQLGLSLASALIAFVGEFREAATRISNLSNEIGVTSACLQRLGDLAKQKGLYGDRGVLEASSLTERCRVVIFEIRTTLKKGDDPLDPKTVKKTEIEVSCFDKLKWAAWSQRKLDVPRAELERLKADITLTFVSLMAVGATTQAEKSQYAGEIPGITKTLRWANRKYEEAVNRQAQGIVQSPPPIYNGQHDSPRLRPTRQSSYVENEAEGWKAFIEYNEAKIAKEEEKRQREKLELQRLEEERKQEEERVRREFIAARAIAEYEEKKRKEEAEKERRIAEANDNLRKRLEDAHIPEDQIQTVLNETSPHQALVPFHPKVSTNDDNPIPNPAANAAETKHNPSIFSRIQKRFRASASSSSHDAFQRHVGFDALEGPYVLEAWAIDQLFQHRFRIPISDAWLANYIARLERQGKDRKMWKRYSKLHPWYKKEISELFEEKLQDQKYVWSMVSLEKVPNRSRNGLMRHGEDQICLQLILKRSRYHGGPRYQTNGSGGPYDKRPRRFSSASSSDDTQYTSSISTLDSSKSSRKLSPRRRIIRTRVGEPKSAKNTNYEPSSSARHHQQTSDRRRQPIIVTGDSFSAQNRPEPKVSKGKRHNYGSSRGQSHRDRNDGAVATAIIEVRHGLEGTGKTIVPQSLVNAGALSDFGYQFDAEDDKFMIDGALDEDEIKELIEHTQTKRDYVVPQPLDVPLPVPVSINPPVRPSRQSRVAFNLPSHNYPGSNDSTNPRDHGIGIESSASAQSHRPTRQARNSPVFSRSGPRPAPPLAPRSVPPPPPRSVPPPPPPPRDLSPRGGSYSYGPEYHLPAPYIYPPVQPYSYRPEDRHPAHYFYPPVQPYSYRPEDRHPAPYFYPPVQPSSYRPEDRHPAPYFYPPVQPYSHRPKNHHPAPYIHPRYPMRYYENQMVPSPGAPAVAPLNEEVITQLPRAAREHHRSRSGHHERGRRGSLSADDYTSATPYQRGRPRTSFENLRRSDSPTPYNSLNGTRKSTISGREAPFGYDYDSRDRYENLDSSIRIGDNEERERTKRFRDIELRESGEERFRLEELRKAMGEHDSRTGQKSSEERREDRSYLIRKKASSTPRRFPTPPLQGVAGLVDNSLDRPREHSRSWSRHRYRDDDEFISRRSLADDGTFANRKAGIARKASLSSDESIASTVSMASDGIRIAPKAAIFFDESSSYVHGGGKGKEREETDAEIIEKQLALYTHGDRSTSSPPGPPPEARPSRPSSPTVMGVTGDEPVSTDDRPMIGNVLHDEPETIPPSPPSARVVEVEDGSPLSTRTISGARPR